jgi:RNA polymerase sigma-70 factor (ECF subfamily)
LAEAGDDGVVTDDAATPSTDEAFGAELAAERPALVRFAWSVTRDSAMAEDLAQEAILRAYERRDQLADVTNLRAWLRRTVHNLAIDRSRRDREIAVEDVEADWKSDEFSVDAAEVVLAAETRVELEDALARLPAIYRSAVVLHDVDGLTVREIAEIGEVELPAAKQRLRRGRMMLVSALATGHERRQLLQGVPMRCWDARVRVSDYLDGDVDEPTVRRLETHLENCPTCPPLLASLVGVRDQLGSLRDPDTVVEPEIAARLRTHLSPGAPASSG